MKETTGNGLWVWHCWAILVPTLPATPAGEEQPFLSRCDEPVRSGSLREGDEVRLECWAFPLSLSGEPAVEAMPLGPYGCHLVIHRD